MSRGGRAIGTAEVRCNRSAFRRAFHLDLLPSTTATALKAPGFFVTSYAEFTKMGAIKIDVKAFYDQVTSPALFGVLAMGTDHNSYGDIASDPHAGIGGAASDAVDSRGAIAAWFDWQLKGRSEVRAGGQAA